MYICESFGNISFLYSMKSFLGVSKNLVDAELIYNLSSLDHFDIFHSLISDWINMELMQVSHPDVILFLLLVVFIFFGVYFLSDVSPLQIFTSTVLAPEKPSSGLGNIVSLCSSLTDIWNIWFFFFTRLIFVLTNSEYYQVWIIVIFSIY